MQEKKGCASWLLYYKLVSDRIYDSMLQATECSIKILHDGQPSIPTAGPPRFQYYLVMMRVFKAPRSSSGVHPRCRSKNDRWQPAAYGHI